jgi:hypothetical protein
MTDSTGWPDASKPGVPLNPERDGWHWLWADTAEMAKWSATVQMWSFGHDDWHTPWWLGGRLGYAYLGPCHTPAEVAALLARAEKAERKRDRLLRAVNQISTVGLGPDHGSAQWQINAARAIAQEAIKEDKTND